MIFWRKAKTDILQYDGSVADITTHLVEQNMKGPQVGASCSNAMFGSGLRALARIPASHKRCSFSRLSTMFVDGQIRDDTKNKLFDQSYMCFSRRYCGVTCGAKRTGNLIKLGSSNIRVPEQHSSRSGIDSFESLDYGTQLQGLKNKGSSSESKQPLAHRVRWDRKLENVKGRLLYSYYNWRQDTLSDLVLFSTFNLMLLVLGGWFQVGMATSVLSWQYLGDM